MKQSPLKLERELRGWSQAKVAKALNTNQRTICRWEMGQAVPTPFFRELLCELFGKDAEQLGFIQRAITDIEIGDEGYALYG